MPALQTNSKKNLLPVIYGDVFNQPLVRPLMYKHIQPAYEKNMKKRKASKKRNQFSYMGLVIPFHPCMWDDKKVEAAWNEAMEMVQTKMKGKYASECTHKLMDRLNKMFGRLNFNTHRKSLAVTFTPDKENITYLSFPVRPAVFFSKSVSLFDLATNIQREPEFNFLVLNKDYTILYDYNNRQLCKVYEQKDETCPAKFLKNVIGVIGIVNGKNQKPIFVTGSPNLVKLFCNSEYYSESYFPLLYDKAPFSSAIIQTLIKEITGHWSYWRSKFITGNVLLAQKTNGLISHTQAVLQALQSGADGLLLIDKRLKHQLQKPPNGIVIFQLADDLINQIEKFLARGNRFEITETGLLKEMGGIVLLQSNTPHNMAYKPYGRCTDAGGSLY